MQVLDQLRALNEARFLAIYESLSQQGFGPLPQGFRFLDYGKVEQLEQAVGPHTCAVLLEPLQGEAGVVPAPRGYLA